MSNVPWIGIHRDVPRLRRRWHGELRNLRSVRRPGEDTSRERRQDHHAKDLKGA
jgi:hypothetical protein